MTRSSKPVGLLLAVLVLSGCDQLGIESASAVAGRKEAEGKAIGAACRHAGRPIEDCYSLNKKADKAAIFSGWREMNDYMRENSIEAVAPQLPQAGTLAPTADDGAARADAGHGAAGDEPPAKASKGSGKPATHGT